VATAQSTRHVTLSRDMGLLDVTMIGVGAMIGAGIFVLTGIAAGQAGPALILAFLLNGVVALLTALAYAELAAAFPEAGGGYLWVREAIPGAAGFVTGWISWFGHSVACSVYTLGFGAYLGEMFRNIVEYAHWQLPFISAAFGHEWFAKGAGITACAVFTYINFRGASETGKAGTLVTLSKLVILAVFVGSGLYALAYKPDWRQHFQPFFPNGWGGVFAAMGLTYIAFEGYEIIAQCGEEVKRPQRNLPLAIILSILMVVPIYCLVAFVCIAAITPAAGQATWQTLGNLGELGLVEAARQFMVGGRFVGGLILLLGGLFSTVSALNATIYSSSRVSFALGRNRNLPDIFAAIHHRYRTPHVAVIVSGALIALMAVALPIKDVASAADVMFLMMFVLINIALISLRQRRPDLKRSFRVPLVPYIPLVAAITSIGLTVRLFVDSPKAGLVTVIWLTVGLLGYYLYARRREEVEARAPVVFERVPVREANYRVLIPVANPSYVESLATVAAAVSKYHDGEVIGLNVIAVPEILPIEEAVRFRGHAERLLDKVHDVLEPYEVPVHTIVRASHRVKRAILDTIVEHDVDMAVVGWRGWTETSNKVLGTVLDAVVRHARCDLAILKTVNPVREAKRILVGVTGSPQSALSIRTAKAISALLGAEVDYVHFFREGEPEPVELVEYWSSRPDPALQVQVRLQSASSPTAGLVRAAAEYDLLILGAAREALMQQLLFGTKTRTVASLVKRSVLMVKQYEGPARAAVKELFTPIEEEERHPVDYGEEQ